MTLHLDHLTVTHGERVLVEAGDLTLEPGRPVTLVGESGSGKSLLAHALMGTLPGTLTVRGRMTLDDTAYDLGVPDNRRGLWGRALALLPQEPALALDPTMRVRDQVAEGVPGFRQRRRAAHELADDALAGLGLGHVAAAWPHTLSGGMAQRVAYAAATVGGARLLIVDEPSKGLDRASLDRLADLLTAHVAGGGLLLTITHDLDLARRLGGEVVVMRDAEVLERGPAERVLGAPEHAYTRLLLDAEPGRWDLPWMRDHAADGERLVTASGIAKGYDTPLFDSLDLTIGAGERWALTGPSGSGKTTLGNVLLGVTRPDAGTVVRAPALASRAQKLYQDPALSFPAKVPLGVALDDVRRRHGVPASRLSGLVERVGLGHDLLGRRPGEVSGGELQRLAVVRAMVTDPLLLVADEATSRLDLLTQRTTTDCLMEQVDESGCALVLVTHDHALAAALADRELVLGRAEVTV